MKPAVVTIRTEGVSNGARALPDSMQEFRDRFFRDRPGRTPQPRQGMGSGFVIDAGGIIVTNNHVIEGASKITVILDDGSELEAKLLGRDGRVDIAVLQVEAEAPLPTIAWGDSDTVQVGDWALAIGSV